jgi:uncharacterized protein GlcG (DUF336 family)
MLKLAEANRAIAAALAKAKELTADISVSVCDAYGHLIAHQRMDNVFVEAVARLLSPAKGFTQRNAHNECN